MRKLINLPVYLKKNEKDLIEKASEFACLGQSAFVRSVSVKEARRILKEVENGKAAN